jgi:hypothetical protein
MEVSVGSAERFGEAGVFFGTIKISSPWLSEQTRAGGTFNPKVFVVAPLAIRDRG